MSYLGNEPQFTQYPSKFFNGNGTAQTVALDYAPPNAAAVLVFIDGVRQDTSAYTLAGTNLTFTGSVPSGTNNVQVVHMGLIVDVGVPGDGTVTNTKLADNAVDGTHIAMGSDAQGDVLFYGGTDYERLAAGTSGYFLKTLGSGADPAWAEVPAGAPTGGGAEKVFYENENSVDSDYTLTTNFNAVSAGPVTVASGVTVTIPAGQAWVIV